MLDQVKKAFKGKEPGMGGYGSEFSFSEHKDGVLLELEADWAPRCSTPRALITNVEGENIYLPILRLRGARRR